MAIYEIVQIIGVIFIAGILFYAAIRLGGLTKKKV